MIRRRSQAGRTAALTEVHVLKRLIFLILALQVVACAAPQGPGASQAGGADGPRRSVPKRAVAAIQGDPHTVFQQLNPASRVRGIDAIEQLVAAGLTLQDGGGVFRPQLAEAVPSVDNGLWRLFPDGRMETTWRIREGAQWHDGTPFTADDLVFTARVVQDRDLLIFGNTAYDAIEDVQAPDPRTVVVRWKQPFIEADTLFTNIRAVPIPRHLLERPYIESKATFIEHPYWSQEFVGTGPFKLREWTLGSHLVVEANDRYVLGRPSLDEVQVRFIEDANTLAANLLAGTVDVAVGRNLSGEQALQVRDQWRGEGRMELSYENWISLYPQLLTPNPAVIGDVRFRKAMMYALDRQQIVDVLQPGLTTVSQSYMSPNQQDYREIEERNVVRYEYDPRRAAQMIEGLGYTKAGDGFYTREPGAPRLAVEVRTTAGDDLREKMLFAIADDWQRSGVGVEPVIVPRQRADDLEYRATFPSFEITRNPNDVRGLRSQHSRNTPLPENSFRVTGNRSRYINADWDALVDRFFMTIPKQERLQVLGQILQHMSDQLPIMGVLYNTSPTLVNNRLVNVSAGGQGSTQTWNAHEWDIK